MRAGDQLDRFELVSLAGVGGMGAVWRARDRDSGGEVAIKVLHVLGEAQQQRFRREAQVLADLDHPSIVRYVAHGVAEDGAPWLAMEWLEGEGLEVRLQ